MHSRSSFLLTFFITQLLSESYDGWIQPPSKLPRSSNRMAVGYDYYTDTIRLLGGEFTRKKQLLSFKDNTFIDHGEYNLSHNIYGSSQYFRQIDNNLWMIDESGNHFNKFNLHTLQLEYNYNSITIPSNVQGSSCLTSISIQNNDNYLIVVGGSIPGSVPLSLVQIFNMTGNVWLSNVPNMQQPRMQHACSTHGDLLYAIGGIISHPVRTNSIEILNISELHDIQSEQWSFIDNLLEPMNNNFALVYKNDIIVIGGDTVQGNHVDQINVIDTLTNTVTAGGYLSHQIDTISSILIFPYIYIFGGTDNAQVFDTWQYHILIQGTEELASSNACFSSASFVSGYEFNAPYNGEIYGIKLVHNSGGVTCNNAFALTNWGCNAGGGIRAQMIHIDGGTYYPTIATDDVSQVRTIIADYGLSCSQCDVHFIIMGSSNPNSATLIYTNPIYHVTTDDKFMLQDSEGCCNVSTFDNAGTSCASVYFLYKSISTELIVMAPFTLTQGIVNHAAGIYNHRLFVINGDAINDIHRVVSDSIYLYAFLNQSWITKNITMPLNTTRISNYGDNCVQIDHLLYIINPMTYGPTAAVISHHIMFVYDLSLNEYILSSTSIPLHKGSYACSVYDNKNHAIYTIGGYDGNNLGLSYTQKYNITASIWTEVDTINIGRYHAGCSMDITMSNIFLFGGLHNNNNLNSIEKYDVNSNQWSELPVTLNTARRHHVCRLLPNDEQIYCMGGYDGTNKLDSVEIFDPTYYDIQITRLNVARFHFQASLWSESCMVITGGNSYLDSVEYIGNCPPGFNIQYSYHLIDESLTWQDGKTRCEALGSTLATITSQ
eukprot:399421_1